VEVKNSAWQRKASMIISQTSQYALKALIFLIQEEKDKPVKVKKISEHIGVPQNYLSKIFHILTRKGILKSSTGKLGGFRLGLPPNKLLLSDIIEPFESSDFPKTCLLGQSVCSDESPCSAHHRWQLVSGLVTQFFDTTTLQELIEREKKSEVKLPNGLLPNVRDRLSKRGR
jgi:Rrf2 family protein